jgi:hypothetical protein
MATFVNFLRLTELATGEGSGTWGTTTNQSLELIGEALGYATQQAFGSDADATTTVADGASDPARAMYYKITSAASLTATRTLTIAPNTISRVMFIENATTGSQSIAISQGSGASVTIATGKTAVVYLDGAGATAAVVDAMAGVDPGVTDTLTEVLVAGNTSGGTNIELSTTDKVQFRDAAIYLNSSVDGQLDIVADTEIQIAATTVDLNGNLDVSGTTVSAGKITADAGIDIDNINIDGTTIALSSGDLTLDVAGDIVLDAGGSEIRLSKAGTEFGKFATDIGTPSQFAISSSVLDGDIKLQGNDGGITITALTLDMSEAGAATFNSSVTATGTSVFASLDISGDIDVDGTANLDVVDIDGAVDMASTLGVTGVATLASLVATTADINAGTIDNTVIGGSTAAAGTFTTFTSTGIDDNATSTAITIDASENVGIGDTTFAAGKLQVYDSNGNHVWLKGRASDGTSSVSFRNNADNAYNGRIQVADTGGMLFQVAGSTRATIDASGNLLFSNADTVIGTNTSDSADTGAIYLCGGGNQTVGRGANIRVHGNEDTLAGDVYIYSGNVAGSDILLSAYSATSTIQFSTNNTERFRIAADGSLSTPTAGTSNVRLGVNAGNSIASGGNYNTVVGDEAGTAITTGDFNTALGYQAGAAITTGIQNTLIGGTTGDALTTGSYNTAFGISALTRDTAGSKSVAIGTTALAYQNFTSATDAFNTAVGHEAGLSVTTGVQNTLIGGLAGDALTEGFGNVALGYSALSSDTLGKRSVAIGHQTLLNQNFTSVTDVFNTAVGHEAGKAVTTGVSNTLIGGLAGDSLTDADYNVAVGAYALTSDTLGSRAVAIGYAALENQNFISATDSYNIGIGWNAGGAVTTGVSNTLIGGLAGDAITTASYNTALGYAALSANCGAGNSAVGHVALLGATGLYSTALGYSAGSANTSGGNNLFLGKEAGLTGSPGGNITTASNEICLGDENISSANIQVDWTVASDARDKTDFTALDLGLDFVKALAPVTYKWDKRSKYGDKTAEDYDLNAQTPDGTHKEDWLDIGFKAQDVEALEIAAGYNKDNKTNLVSSHTDDGKQMGLQYSKFVPILVKAIQEQQALIESLTARIAALEE